MSIQKRLEAKVGECLANCGAEEETLVLVGLDKSGSIATYVTSSLSQMVTILIESGKLDITKIDYEDIPYSLNKNTKFKHTASNF